MKKLLRKWLGPDPEIVQENELLQEKVTGLRARLSSREQECERKGIALQSNYDVLCEIEDILFFAGKHTESTSCPFWYIATKGGAAAWGRNVIHKGIWFDRTSAERYLLARPGEFPKKAFVYCESGEVGHLRKLRAKFSQGNGRGGGWRR